MLLSITILGLNKYGTVQWWGTITYTFSCIWICFIYNKPSFFQSFSPFKHFPLRSTFWYSKTPCTAILFFKWMCLPCNLSLVRAIHWLPVIPSTMFQKCRVMMLFFVNLNKLLKNCLFTGDLKHDTDVTWMYDVFCTTNIYKTLISAMKRDVNFFCRKRLYKFCWKPHRVVIFSCLKL